MAEADCPWSGWADAEPALGDFTVENPRQSAPEPGRDLPAGNVGGRLGAAARTDGPVGRNHPAGNRIPMAVLAYHFAAAAAARSIVACLLHGSRSRRYHECAAVRAGSSVSTAPGGCVRRRHNSHALPTVHQ